MQKFKKLVIALAVIFLVSALIYTIKPIYYRVYPFDRFTVNYSITADGKEIESSEQYYHFEDDEKNILNSKKGKFKIKGGIYGIYNFGLVADNEELYNKTNDEYFLSADDLDFRFVFFNTNSWHIADIDIDIQIEKIDGERLAFCHVEYTYPHVDETGKLVTESTEQEIKLDDLKETEIHFQI